MSNQGLDIILIVNRLQNARLTALPFMSPVDFEGWQTPILGSRKLLNFLGTVSKIK
jgi:hypothetical protein